MIKRLAIGGSQDGRMIPAYRDRVVFPVFDPAKKYRAIGPGEEVPAPEYEVESYRSMVLRGEQSAIEVYVLEGMTVDDVLGVLIGTYRYHSAEGRDQRQAAKWRETDEAITRSLTAAMCEHAKPDPLLRKTLEAL